VALVWPSWFCEAVDGLNIRVLSTCRIGHRKAIYLIIYLFNQAISSPLQLRGAPDTTRILCRSFTPKRQRQLWVKDLPKVHSLRSG